METAIEQSIKEIVSGFISGRLNITSLHEDEDLFESGIVNSLFSIQLITFIEKKFGVKVGSDDLDMDNFKSINAVTAFVERKQKV